MRIFSRSFAGGEVTPELFGRLDDARFQTGLAKAQNFITLPHGPARKRPGTEYIATPKYAGAKAFRPLRFSFSPTDSVVIEAGEGYFRFFVQGVRTTHTPRAHVASQVVVFTPGTGVVTWAGAHNLQEDDPVQFSTTGALPVITATGFGLTPGAATLATTYYAAIQSPTTIKLRTAAGGATIGAYLTAGAGVHTGHFFYQIGDSVASGGSNYYCQVAPIGTAPPSATYWYVQPSGAPGIYEVPSPYLAADLAGVRYQQSNDVLTLMHRSYPTIELRRYSATRWALVQVALAPTLAAPTASGAATQGGVLIQVEVVAAANPLFIRTFGAPGLVSGDGIYGTIAWTLGSLASNFYRVVSVNGSDMQVVLVNGSPIDASTFGAFTVGQFRAVPLYSDLSNSYKVTVVDAKGGESTASNVATVSNNLNAEGAYNTVSWTAVTGAAQFRIYRLSNGLYGLIGAVDGATLSLKDDDLAVQLDKSPPFLDTTIGTSYPEAGCYHEQRRVFARDQSVWMTRTGTESDLTYSIPTRDDDRVAFTIASTERCRIQHMMSMGGAMLALTDTIEFAIVSPDGVVITPTSVMPRPQAYVGASSVRPQLVNSSIFYCAASGGHVRELNFQLAAQSFQSVDVSLRAAHLFDGLTLTSMARCKAPYSIVWVSSSNGKLLGLTSVPDQQVAGWHQHSIGGTSVVVEECTSVLEDGEDRLYLAVLRTVNGVATRYLERMASMTATRFLDCHAVVTNVAAGLVGGFSHLVGATVDVLADGIVFPSQVVNASGQITLPATQVTYASVIAGYQIDAQLRSLPMVLQTEGFGQADRKNVSKVFVRLSNSAPCKIGPSLGALSPSHADAPSVRGLLVAETMRTEPVPVRVPGTWSDDGQVYVVSTVPLPCTVVALTFEMSAG